ncbi:MAG: RluA family pseudouridine synthase [bacterium]|nr:RluA family pseudouridine synthase [bacterium]
MINIIYEDNHLLIVEKPINVPVQEDISKDLDFLSMLKNYIKKRDQKKGNVYLGLVHRLDRPVGGIMVFAKTSKCAKRLSEQIRNRTFKKEYYAVVEGILKKEDTLKDKLLKDRKNNIVRVDPKGLDAELNYKLIDFKNNLSLVKINLKTGRSHQIRVQFSSRNHPLYGDLKYNKNANVGDSIALFSKKIEFDHPITKERLTFELNLPKRYPWVLFL